MAIPRRVTRSASQVASPDNGSSSKGAQGTASPKAIVSKSTNVTKTTKIAGTKRQAKVAPTAEPAAAAIPKRSRVQNVKAERKDMPPPEAPPAKRQRKGVASSSAPPTPTPALAKDFAAAASAVPSSDIPESRPADPEATNAPLATPRGTRYVAYPLDNLAAPQYLPAPRATTKNLLEKACAHLCAADPRMKQLIEAHPCPLFTPAALATPVDPFAALVSGILAQQVSGAAAASIKRKFIALFNESGNAEDQGHEGTEAGSDDAPNAFFPQPAQVVTRDVTTLRTAGLSQRKAEYVIGLAQKFVDGELSAAILAKASWDEVLEKLTAVRGLGVWSVEMFGCFALKRMDIFSTGDLGVQRGLAAFVGRDVKKLKAKGGGKWKYMSEKEMLEHSAKFAPYRTLFMWYMWRVEDVNIDAVQGASI